MSLTRKILITFIGLNLVILAQLNVLDEVGSNHTQAGLQRALVTYGVSRGLNSVISVVQGTEVAIEPVGIGMTFTPGQILDPVNDLIERFSTVVLVSASAFGVQRILLDVVSSLFFSIIVGFITMLALLALWWRNSLETRNLLSRRSRVFLWRTALIFLVIRFSIPLTAIGSETVYDYFLASSYQESSQTLLTTTSELKQIQTQTESVTSKVNESKSLLDSARDLYFAATQKLDMQQHIDSFKLEAEKTSEHVIQLLVIFVFQTLLLPLFSVWLTLKVIKYAALGMYINGHE